MASAHDSKALSANNKVPVECLDDCFGFNAEVVYGDKSFPLHRCSPFLTTYGTQPTPTVYGNERTDAEAEDGPELRHGMQDMSSADNHGPPNATPHLVWPEDTDDHNNHNHLIFTDGGPPVTVGGLGNSKPQQMESLVLLEEEEWDKHPRTRMKKGGERGGKKSRQKQ